MGVGSRFTIVVEAAPASGFLHSDRAGCAAGAKQYKHFSCLNSAKGREKSPVRSRHREDFDLG